MIHCSQYLLGSGFFDIYFLGVGFAVQHIKDRRANKDGKE
jgi:hypothetical protein